ncbi:hypothetical protein P154DRAFT_464080 [Amniculicola lignicola CBS 123094]|uniref:ADF-H domain-containing protein n=1 Tax=Amniculicola lignicola CBS 123094 TaxID=1392246 RepID=A0A6A5WRC3_9PLEO|nr:hypothetical protein P154DRAFT_464080 [Amniculicola lignicola CBS 123094]
MLEVPSSAKEAFLAFTSDPSLLALPFKLSRNTLERQLAIPHPGKFQQSFLSSVVHLDHVLDLKSPLYLVLRRDDSHILITYVPYMADTVVRKEYLDARSAVLEALGESRFSFSLICKEPTEITDQRSWEERDSVAQKLCVADEADKHSEKDKGYHKNKCRLCDRRMKNNITDEAAEALGRLKDPGDCVQISVDVLTDTLELNFQATSLPPMLVQSKLPTDCPSFTFYIHSQNSATYFIFCSPDSATVKERMKHTMAIAGLVNIIAKEAGINVDQKIEIHEREDLEFEQGDDRIGRFRSVFSLTGSTRVGTESTWEGMPVS